MVTDGDGRERLADFVATLAADVNELYVDVCRHTRHIRELNQLLLEFDTARRACTNARLRLESSVRALRVERERLREIRTR